MSGPEATAESIFSFLKMIGMTVPVMLDSSIAMSKAIPVQSETEKASIID